MRYVTWTVRLVVFLVLLAFAVKNTDPVTLRFYFELVWQAPLIVLLLAFFAAGAVFGLAAALSTLFAQRRESLQLRRALQDKQEAATAAADPLPPPGASA